MKTCVTCSETKDLQEGFYRRPGSKDGFHNVCKECRKQKASQWSADNPGARLKAFKKWYAANPEAHAVRTARWKKNNASKRRAHKIKRTALEKQATTPWADHTKMQEFYFAADFLGMVTGDWYHVDHIVPLSNPRVCGLHTEQNLQVLPASDNLRKSNRHWPDMP
jgi:5-methylcytosine-specific restriction endonuclease McrA